MCTLTCNRKTLQLGRKALTMDSKRSKWPLREQPALRSWRPVWKMGNTGILGNTAMELVWKAKLWAALPEIHIEMASFLQDGCIMAKRQTSWKLVQKGACRDWTPAMKPELQALLNRVTLGSGLSICQNSKLQLRADTWEVLESPSIRSFCLSLVFACQLTEIREWK